MWLRDAWYIYTWLTELNNISDQLDMNARAPAEHIIDNIGYVDDEIFGDDVLDDFDGEKVMTCLKIYMMNPLLIIAMMRQLSSQNNNIFIIMPQYINYRWCGPCSRIWVYWNMSMWCDICWWKEMNSSKSDNRDE